MSLIPTMFRDWWDDFDRLDRPNRLLDQHFGLGLTRDELFSLPPTPSRSLRYRPWRTSLLEHQLASPTSSSLLGSDAPAKVQQDRDKFQVIVDVQQFAPHEITVKTVDNAIIVEGRHEEKKDQHGFVSRQFQRRYVIPEGHDIGNVHSSLSSDGVLTVTAPSFALPLTAGEKVIPIRHSSGPALKNY